MRLSFRHNPETMLRRCILVGTTNDNHCLPNDPSGNRRFVVVEVREGPGGIPALREYMDRNREQIWAEALSVYRSGEDSIRLPDELKARQREVNEGHRQSDEVLEGKVLEWLRVSASDPFTLVDAVASVGENYPKGDRRFDTRVAQALKACGAFSTRVRNEKGVQQRVWRKPSV